MTEVVDQNDLTTQPWRTPRSALFVPSHLSALVDKASQSEADAVCLDLEDGVPLDRKAEGRSLLAHSVSKLVSHGKNALIRINSELEYVSYDLEYVPVNSSCVVLPKTQSLQHIESLGNALDRLFGVRHSNDPSYGTKGPGIIAMVETAAAIQHISQDTSIRSHERLLALAVGTEDLSADLSCEPDTGLISHAFDELSFSANRLGVDLLGFPDSISEFEDLIRFEKGVKRGRRSGAAGAFCIHPRQISVLNTVFRPDEDTISWAKRVIECYEEMGGTGAISVDGKMVDPPVYRRALRMICQIK